MLDDHSIFGRGIYVETHVSENTNTSCYTPNIDVQLIILFLIHGDGLRDIVFTSTCNCTYVQHVRSLMCLWHYSDVIMGKLASKINSLTIVYSTVYSGADQRRHQSSASLAFVREIHPQMASNAENGFVWWRHHEATLKNIATELHTRNGNSYYYIFMKITIDVYRLSEFLMLELQEYYLESDNSCFS